MLEHFFSFQRHAKLQEADQEEWWDTFGRLCRILRKAAQVLFIAKKLDKDQMHNYFMSGRVQWGHTQVQCSLIGTRFYPIQCNSDIRLPNTV